MKEVKVIAWCDAAVHEGQNYPVPATTERVLSIDGYPSRVVDLCEVCDKELIAPVWDLMMAGVKPPEPKAKKRKGNNGGGARKQFDKAIGDCPLCEYDQPSREALGQHLATKHNSGFTKLREQGIEVGLIS